MTYVPERGNAIWINFNPQAGHEQADKRATIILSPQNYNGKVGLCFQPPSRLATFR